MTDLKCSYELRIQTESIFNIKDWEVTPKEIRHKDNKFFKVIAAQVEISNREVTAWTQPLVEPVQEGIIAFITKKINGLNVTVPYKKDIINHLDELTQEANRTQSVNTVFLDGDKVTGHNTDISGFELAIKEIDFDIKDKQILILGAGGVVPSIIFALYKMEARKVSVMNRTRSKTENLKNLFKEIVILDWGEIPDCDMIINATSVGLKKEDKINLDFSKISKNKLFYDIFYNQEKNNFF